ncbi:MAG: ABC transporter permease [Flavobacterium sp.]
MSFALYIAKRYLRSASKNKAINIINRIASLGIVAGAMALFVVLSVFSGLKEFSLSFSSAFDPDLKMEAALGKSISVNPKQENQLLAIKGIKAYSKVLEERVLYRFDGKELVTYLKGVDTHFDQVISLKKILYQGNWIQPHTTEVVVGYGLCQKLSLGLYDFNNPLEVYVPRAGEGAIENPDEAFNQTVLMPVGVYAISEDLDGKYVFANLDMVQALLEYPANRLSAVEFKLDPQANETEIRNQLQALFGQNLRIKNRAQLNDSLYKMLNTENVAVYLIFTLVIIIALFNLVGALIMMIIDKKNNLKTLYNLGTPVKELRRIFFWQGTLLSVFGGLIGLMLGVVLVLLQQQFQFIMITPTLAYPVICSFENAAIVLATITILGVSASWIASSRVSKKMLD